MLGGMTRGAASTALSNLLLIAEAVKSKTLKADAKEFLDAAEAADEAEAKLSKAMAEDRALKADLDATAESTARAAETNATAREKLAADRTKFRAEVRETTESQQAETTRLANASAAMEQRDKRLTASEKAAEKAIADAEKAKQTAELVKRDYEGRIARLEAAASGA